MTESALNLVTISHSHAANLIKLVLKKLVYFSALDENALECVSLNRNWLYLLALDCVFLLFCRHHINDIFVFPLHSRWANPGWHWARGEERFNWLPDHHMADTWGQTTIHVPVPVHADKQFRVTNEPARLWIVRWSQSTCRTPTQRWGQHANCFLQISPVDSPVRTL